MTGHARQLAHVAVQPLGVPPRARADPERGHSQRSGARASARAAAGRSAAWTFEAFLRETDTDGIAILHRGKLVFERYANGMTDETPHILMSVSKSMLGSAAARRAGALDPERQVTQIVPEIAGHRVSRRDHPAPARHARRHRVGRELPRDLRPDRRVPQGDRLESARAGETPSDLHSFYPNLKAKDGAHGGRFHYSSPNSDLLGWVIERATGRRYADLMSELVWKPIGAERSAYITVDRLGAPRCAGGMCATLRDLARVGHWLIEQRPDFVERPRAQRRPEGVGGRRPGASTTRACRCAIAASGTSLRRRDSAAGLRHGHPRPEPVRRPRERHRDRQVLLAGGAARRRAHRADHARRIAAEEIPCLSAGNSGSIAAAPSPTSSRAGRTARSSRTSCCRRTRSATATPRSPASAICLVRSAWRRRSRPS